MAGKPYVQVEIISKKKIEFLTSNGWEEAHAAGGSLAYLDGIVITYSCSKS